MRKIKIIVVTFLLAATWMSCEDDGGTSKREVTEAGAPDIQKIETEDSFINLNEIQSGNEISIGITVDVGIGDVKSMDVVGFYIKASGEVERAVLASGVTTFPTSLTFTKQELIDTFTLLNSNDDFELGDQLKISADVTLGSGLVINLLTDEGGQNYGSYLDPSQARYSVYQAYNVSCPSDLGGTYSIVSSGASTDPGPSASENPISNYPYTTTITDNGGGSYTMADAYGGLYILWYDIYGVTGDEPGSFTDVCGTLSGSFTEPFGAGVNLTGTANPDGTLTIHWENDYGDFGDSVYTPAD